MKSSHIAYHESKSYIYTMSRDELKIEIHKIIDNIPEGNLDEVYKLLKELESTTKDKIVQYNLLNKVLNEDRELLKKLAK